MLATVDGRLWITETGGIVRHVDADGRVRWPYDEERARASLVRSLALADRHADRIERLYVYQWQAAALEPWDSGLTRPNGTARPSFDALLAHLRPAALPETPRPGASPPGTRSPAAVARVLPPPLPELARRGAHARLLPGGRAATVQGATDRADEAGPPPRAVDAGCWARTGASCVRGRRRRSPSGSPRSRRRLIRQGRTTELLAEVSAATSWRKRFVVDCRR